MTGSFTIFAELPSATWYRPRCPRRTAMEVSGEKTRSMFDRYNIVSIEQTRAAIDKMRLPVPAKTESGEFPGNPSSWR